MTRFIAIRPHGPQDVGARLRLDYDPDFGNVIISDENVLPEQMRNPDANNVTTLASMQLTPPDVEWLHVETGNLLAAMLPVLAHEAAVDRRITQGTDRLRAVSAVLQAALVWRHGGRVVPLIAAIDALVAEGHAPPPPVADEPGVAP
jgi:hypothetical protein